MKITVDTKEDSKEEIIKVIKLLSSLAEGKEEVLTNKNIFDDNKEPNLEENVFGMFDMAEKKDDSKKTTAKEDDIPRIITYDD